MAFTWERNTGAGDGEIRVYVDGSEVISDTTASFDAFTVAEVRFGKERSSAGRQFQGSADEIAIWNSALAPAQVRAQHGAVPEPSSSALLGLGGLALLLRRRK